MSFRVVVAGGGVAGVETVLALHDLAGDRVDVVLLAEEPTFRVRALTTATPFSAGHVLEKPLSELAERTGATLRLDPLERVEPGERYVELASGERLHYDALVLAAGAVPRPGVGHATTFGLEREQDAVNGILADLEEGYSRSVAFVVPPGVTWSLPAYELALMTAGEARGMGMDDVRVHVVTPEPEPLVVFGEAASRAVAGLLERAGVTFTGSVEPEVPKARHVTLGDGRHLEADRIVALPVLDGPRIPGVPADDGGFIPVDDHGRVLGGEAPGVYAVGDGADYPVKQGGLATQQADAAAADIARQAGAGVEPEPFRPVLRGRLLTGRGAQYLEHAARGGDDRTAELTLWAPAAKVQGRHLTAWLGAGEEREAAPAGDGDGGAAVEVPLPAPDELRRGAANLDPYAPYLAELLIGAAGSRRGTV
jgi:sulfide:quinone oxidoreductase